MNLKLVKTNNYFGQHDFVLEDIADKTTALADLNEIKWHKTPTIIERENEIYIHCFTNYDKVKIEGRFANG